jgi:hypothetical protein
VSAQNCALPTLSDLKQIKKTWASAWPKRPSHVDTLGFAHGA